MTRIRSTAFPISSVIAVEGVSGEMAIPAFIFALWICLTKASGSSKTALDQGGTRVHPTHWLLRSGNSTMSPLILLRRPPTDNLLSRLLAAPGCTYLLGLRNHHVTVHKDLGDTLVHAGQDRWTCGSLSLNRTGRSSPAELTHSNIWYKMPWNTMSAVSKSRAWKSHPSITSTAVS